MENNIDITKYPEGFNELIKALNFLPDDYNARSGYLMGIALILLNA